MGHMIGQVKATIIALMVAVLAIFAPAALAQEEMVAPEVAEQAVEASSASGYVPMTPTIDKGMPTNPRADTEGALAKSLTFQDQYTETGAFALGMHDYLLLPVITAISLFVLALLVYVMVRFRRRANPESSRTTHNTAIEVVWTIVPVLILIVIAIPSIALLAEQYETPPEEAITIKAVGNQWYWTYEYPDHGDVEIISKMLNEPGRPVVNPGVRDVGSEAWDGPAQLEVDNRMVVPAGVPLRIQTTAANVIHAFAVPSLWFKMDAVPGRLNEKLLTIEEPGVYYGQCSELCGALHGYMPIAVEALPMDEFNVWVLEQGGTIPGSEVAEAEDAPAQVALAE